MTQLICFFIGAIIGAFLVLIWVGRHNPPEDVEKLKKELDTAKTRSISQSIHIEMLKSELAELKSMFK